MGSEKREKSAIFEKALQAAKNCGKAIQAFWIRLLRKKRVSMFILGILATVIVIFLFSALFGAKHSAPAIISTSTLQKIVKVSDLSTFESIYNGIATVPNPKKEGAISYYVSYDGRVKAGINVEDITIDMECYYHNVAKYMENDASGTLWWKKDRKFWIEYAGIVTVGIDASKVKIEIDGSNVTITIPSAKILGCKVDKSTLTPQSFYVDKSSAPVEAAHQTEAYKDAQKKLLEEASANTVLLANAQDRAQKLLEDYVNNIGTYLETSYTIRWVYLDEA